MLKEFVARIKNIKVVKLPNERYGIRKGWLRYRYYQPVESVWKKYPSLDVTHDDLNMVASFYDYHFLDMSVEIELERYNDS